VVFNGYFQVVLVSLLLIEEFIGRLIQLVDMIAEVLRGGKLEEIRVESGHVRLDMVEQESLHKMASIDANRYFVEEFGNGKALRANALLHQIDLVGGGTCYSFVCEGFDSFFGETEAVEGVESKVGLAHIIDNED
jgi:hypothetical protein